MHVVLIHALEHESTGYLKHGIGLLSAVLKQQGHRVDLITDFRRQLGNVSKNADIYGISTLSSSMPEVAGITKYLREKNEITPIFVGGPGATLSPEFLLPIEEVNYIFRGEGEITFPEIINHYERWRTLPQLRVIDGEIVTDLNKLPFVDRTGYKHGEDRHGLFEGYPKHVPMYSMFNSRWCRRKCKFCAPAMSNLFGGIKKLRSVSHFMAEVETLPHNDMLMIIHDDNFLENQEWVHEFYQEMTDRNWYIPFTAQVYPAEILKYHESLEKLQEIGLIGVFAGFESGSTRMLKYMRKGTNRDINIKAAKILKDLGIRIQANLMFGNPTETLMEMLETVSFYNTYVHESGLTIPSPAVYTPLPGSEWYQELVDSGEFVAKSYKDFELYHWTKGKLKSVNYKDVEECIGLLKRGHLYK